MVIVTTEEVRRHAFAGLEARPQRRDVYAKCSCGYKGPSREVDPNRGIDMSEEARKDWRIHRDVEERDNEGQIRWKVRITPTALARPQPRRHHPHRLEVPVNEVGVAAAASIRCCEATTCSGSISNPT